MAGIHFPIKRWHNIRTKNHYPCTEYFWGLGKYFNGAAPPLPPPTQKRGGGNGYMTCNTRDTSLIRNQMKSCISKTVYLKSKSAFCLAHLCLPFCHNWHVCVFIIAVILRTWASRSRTHWHQKIKMLRSAVHITNGVQYIIIMMRFLLVLFSGYKLFLFPIRSRNGARARSRIGIEGHPWTLPGNPWHHS